MSSFNVALNEIYIILSLIGYGIFILTIYDLGSFILDPLKNSKIKIIIRLFIELMMAIMMIYITYRFTHNLNHGDISLYFILFLIIGFVLYHYYFKKAFIISLNHFKSIFLLLLKPLKKVFKWLFLAPMTYQIIKIPFHRVFRTIRNFITIWKKPVEKNKSIKN